MVDYYRILNLKWNKEKGNITDELVEKHYIERVKICEEYGIKFFKTEAMLNEYRIILDSAYMALATENARKQYDELIDMLEHIQTKETEKQKNIEPKTRKVDTNNGKISSLKVAMQNITKTPDTKEILEQIKQKAQKDHLIPKPEELGER